MSSLSPKDRVSLCSFTFSDGRRCRTPRARNNPHFCYYHAEKEARSRTAQKLGKDLSYFFSGNYLSACDLSSALARLIPAVVRGDVKPRAARTVAYLAQTLLQSIHVAQHEYINAFGTDGWRQSVRHSVNSNSDYLFPFTPSEAEGPAPQPAPGQPADQAPQVGAGLQTGAGEAPVQPAQPTSSPAPHAPSSPVCHPACPDPVGERSDERPTCGASPESYREGPQPIPATQQPAPSPRTPLHPTSAEFVQHVVAGLQTGQNLSRPITHLESTFTRPPTAVDSKPLT
jgi:hypothetical protein